MPGAISDALLTRSDQVTFLANAKLGKPRLDHQQATERPAGAPLSERPGKQERTRGVSSTKKAGSICSCLPRCCNYQTVTSKTGSTWKGRAQRGSPVVFWSATLARSWVDLPACGAAHWGLLSVADPFGSRQVLPFARQDNTGPW